jgi:hypothetical protein
LSRRLLNRVYLVILGKNKEQVLHGKSLLDRGRGRIIETTREIEDVDRGRTAVLVYEQDGEDYFLRCFVAEVITPRKIYLIPKGVAKRMEKREFIRVRVQIDASLVPWKPKVEEVKWEDALVELSASGFKWLGTGAFEVGQEAYLCLKQPEPMVLKAKILRCDKESAEVAGQFIDMTPKQRETILRFVFVTAMKQLGFVDTDE